MTARGLAFLYGGESQCGERQDADPAILRAASDACERRIDPEAAGLGYLAGNESEGALDQTKQGRIRGAGRARTANSFSTKREAAERLNAVPSMKVMPTAPSASGLDRIALIDEIADAGLEQSRRRRA